MCCGDRYEEVEDKPMGVGVYVMPQDLRTQRLGRMRGEYIAAPSVISSQTQVRLLGGQLVPAQWIEEEIRRSDPPSLLPAGILAGAGRAGLRGAFRQSTWVAPPFRSGGIGGVFDDVAAWVEQNQTYVLLGLAAVLVLGAGMQKKRGRR